MYRRSGCSAAKLATASLTAEDRSQLAHRDGVGVMPMKYRGTDGSSEYTCWARHRYAVTTSAADAPPAMSFVPAKTTTPRGSCASTSSGAQAATSYSREPPNPRWTTCPQGDRSRWAPSHRRMLDDHSARAHRTQRVLFHPSCDPVRIRGRGRCDPDARVVLPGQRRTHRQCRVVVIAAVVIVDHIVVIDHAGGGLG
jgi:hypothetical protein